MPDPRDIAAATKLVDEALAGASDQYRWLHRDRMISNEVAFQRFVRESRALPRVTIQPVKLDPSVWGFETRDEMDRAFA